VELVIRTIDGIECWPDGVAQSFTRAFVSIAWRAAYKASSKKGESVGSPFPEIEISLSSRVFESSGHSSSKKHSIARLTSPAFSEAPGLENGITSQ